MEPILISIIVPIYNVKDYLTACVNSILSQTYSNIEIILVDDGSTDGSGRLCDEFAAQDSRVRVIHKENGGLVSARKAGAAAAKGEYILNVDGDDWIGENRVENMVERGASLGVDMIYMAGIYKEYEYGSVYQWGFPLEYGIYDRRKIRDILLPGLVDTRVFLKRNISPSLCSWGIKKKLFQEIEATVDNGMTLGEDLVCLLSCIVESNYISCIDEPDYHYIKTRKGSIIQACDSQIERLRLFTEKIKEFFLNHKYIPNLEKVICQYIFHVMLMVEYSSCWFKNDSYLFPYREVKNGSRVVVYGAGNVGKHLISYLRKDPRYPLVAWVDTNVIADEIENDLTVIPDQQYDYILISVLEYETACDIKKSLINKGINEDKIQLMDESILTWENIPSCL